MARRTHGFAPAGKRLLTIGTAAAVIAGLVSCSSGGKSSTTDDQNSKTPQTSAAGTPSSAASTPPGAASSPASGPNAALRALLPDDIRSSGKLTVATTAEYPPYEYLDTDNKTIIGLDPDFGKALGDLFGIKIDFVNTGFPTVVSGLQGGKFDAALDTISDTKSREEAIDLIDYLTVGSQLIVNSGNPLKITDLSSLCGGKIAVSATKGSGQADVLDQESAACEANGKGAVKVQLFDDQPSQLLALQSGRIGAMAAGGGNAGYIASQEGGRFEVLPDQYFTRLYGIGVNKEKTQLRDALVAGMKELLKNGTYAEILKKWNVSNEAVDEITVNNAEK